MFKSGFLIFIITDENLESLNFNPTSLSIIYKQIILNNKINLISNSCKIFNMNSLRFIMIKLGIIYRELYLIEKAMENLKNYDLKTAHLLMQYILETSDLPQIVENVNDNFFIYMIKITINYIIKLYKSRVEILKADDFNKSEFLGNTKFLDYFQQSKNFKEMIILTKYLDLLRNLDNSIYHRRNFVSESLLAKVKNLNVRIQDKSVDALDISYYKNQLYLGKVSDSQNYVIQKIYKSLSNVSLMVLNKMLVELYCYSILQDSEKSLSLCINVLRNVSYNPNLFFKNIAIKTQKKSLRNYLLTHLMHSNFTSKEDEYYFEIISYIDSHYSNPSFNIEYNLKSTKILLQKEFKKINLDYMFNKNYRLNSRDKKENDEYKSILYKNNVERSNGLDNKKEKKKDKRVDLNILKATPLMTEDNIDKLEELLEKKYLITNNHIFFDIYCNFFCNTEIDDFGMNKKREKIKKPHYLDTEYFNTLSTLFFQYFEEHDEKIYMLKNEKNYKCILCNTSMAASTESIEASTQHLGYSNISIENLKYFDISNIIRINFDDYMQIESSTFKLTTKLNFRDLANVSSLFYYIIGHYQTNFLVVFIKKLVESKFFNANLEKDNKIYTEYFCRGKNYFIFMNKSLMEIFNNIDNQYLREIIFSNFIENGILTTALDKIDNNLLRVLIKNNLLKFPESTYSNYYKIDAYCSKEIFIKSEAYEVKNKLNRFSILDEKMDELILNTNDNHYILQTFIDFNLLNPKSIYFKNQNDLNTWQKVILLSNFDISNCIFEISIELYNLLKPKLKRKDNDYNLLIFYGSLMYLKLDNIDYVYYAELLSNDIINGIKTDSLNIFDNFISPTDKPKESQEVVTNPPRMAEKANTNDFSNDILTCNEDVSLKDLVNNYYKFLNNNYEREWIDRSDNFSLSLDNFEILIENGRVMDAYYYYKNYYHNLTESELEVFLYNICLNNLLNYNVFAATVTFLYLMEWENKGRDMIVRIEAANRILLYELNKLARSGQLSIAVEEAIKLVKEKNYNFFNKNYLEINSDEQDEDKKAIITVYKKLVSEFREFCQKSTMQENTIFQTLKRLEDATWDGKKDDLLNNSKEITLDSPWHLVFLFCKTHNYEMSLTLLHELGRNNNWIMFLNKAQDQECPPATVLKILDGYFSDSNLKRHLNIVIDGLLDRQVADNVEGDCNNYLEERSNKIDFGKGAFNDFVIYNIKPKQTKSNQFQPIFDPLYFITLPDSSKDKFSKYANILNESININWKDLILVSLINTNNEIDTVFTAFTIYIFMSIKEILITKNYLEELLKKFENNKHPNISKILIRNLKEIFDSKKKNIKLNDLETFIKVLLLNDHCKVLLEALELFDISFSFDEFVLFCKSFSENDFESAFVHLFLFKNAMLDYFNNSFSNGFTTKVWEEEGIINNINIDFVNSEIETFENLILVFFFQVANSVVNNFIDLYEDEPFKLFKLLEVLYLVKWNKCFSTYFKNMCILGHIKKHDLNYKSSFDNIVDLLIKQNSYSILSEYIVSYEEDKVDDTLLYNIFSMISTFDKHYSLYSDAERNQFWEWLESLLKNAAFTNMQVAKFLLYILETKQEKLFIREQLSLIFKIYNYLNETGYKTGPLCNEEDRFEKFMEKVLSYQIDNRIVIKDVVSDMKNRLLVIIFSNCRFAKLKTFFKDKNSFYADYIANLYHLIIEELKEESPSINFSRVSLKFWKETKTEDSYYTDTNFNKAFEFVCINLINLNQLDLILELSSFYKISIDILDKFNSFMKFLIERFNDIKTITSHDLNNMLDKSINKTLQPTISMLKNYSLDIRDKLENLVYACLQYNSIEKVVLYELLKIIISVELNLDIDLFINFSENLETILYNIIDNNSNSYYIISHLNKLIDNDDLLAKTIIQKFFFNINNGIKPNIKLFRYVQYFKNPYKLGNKVQTLVDDKSLEGIKDTRIHSNYWEIIFLGYYSFLIDGFHNKLSNIGELIKTKIQGYNLIENIFRLFNICEVEEMVKDLFYCLYRTLQQNIHFNEIQSNALLINSFTNAKNFKSQDIFERFKSEIQFYLRSKYFKKLGEIYVKLAYDYNSIIKEKYSIKPDKYTEIIRKEEELTILNFYIRAAEMFLHDNCIKNYEEIFNSINTLIKDNFKDDIDINLE
jgi:hypothetical protein